MDSKDLSTEGDSVFHEEEKPKVDSILPGEKPPIHGILSEEEINKEDKISFEGEYKVLLDDDAINVTGGLGMAKIAKDPIALSFAGNFAFVGAAFGAYAISKAISPPPSQSGISNTPVK